MKKNASGVKKNTFRGCFWRNRQGIPLFGGPKTRFEEGLGLRIEELPSTRCLKRTFGQKVTFRLGIYRGFQDFVVSAAPVSAPQGVWGGGGDPTFLVYILGISWLFWDPNLWGFQWGNFDRLGISQYTRGGPPSPPGTPPGTPLPPKKVPQNPPKPLRVWNLWRIGPSKTCHNPKGIEKTPPGPKKTLDPV